MEKPMTKILHLDSSARSQESATRVLTAEAVAQLKKAHPDATVTYHDLTKDSLPHISPEYLGGIFGNPVHANHETVKLSDKLIAELMEADVIVIGAPMYNFSIPSQLKAWIDYVLRAGKTFKYENGAPVGLVKGKKAIIATASGGIYGEGPMVPFDHVVPLLKQVLGFIGIADITAVRAEKQAFGPEVASASVNEAKAEITQQAKAA
jgi:FMN-dependent NADH-azoreductase